MGCSEELEPIECTEVVSIVKSFVESELSPVDSFNLCLLGSGEVVGASFLGPFHVALG